MGRLEWYYSRVPARTETENFHIDLRVDLQGYIVFRRKLCEADASDHSEAGYEADISYPCALASRRLPFWKI